MSKRAYGQFCGLVRALEMVGERWALLIIRDLFVGPKRFTDLRRGLSKIPTNILSARLRELEEAGVVRRRLVERTADGPAAGAVVYELTEYGRELEDVVLGLGRWGAKSMTEPRPDETVTVDSMIMAMRATFRADAARGVTAGWELRLGEIVLRVQIRDGELAVGEGPLPDADLVLETGPAIKALMAGEVSAEEAIARGGVRVVAGDPALLSRFAEIFRI